MLQPHGWLLEGARSTVQLFGHLAVLETSVAVLMVVMMVTMVMNLFGLSINRWQNYMECGYWSGCQHM